MFSSYLLPLGQVGLGASRPGYPDTAPRTWVQRTLASAAVALTCSAVLPKGMLQPRASGNLPFQASHD